MSGMLSNKGLKRSEKEGIRVPHLGGGGECHRCES